MGPLLLALIPLVTLRLLLDRSARQGSVRGSRGHCGRGVSGLDCATLVFNFARSISPSVPGIALLCSACSGGIRYGGPGRSLGSLGSIRTGGLVAFVLALTCNQHDFNTIQADFLSVTFGAESEQAYLERRLGTHHEAMQAINRLDEGSTVRLLWEPRSYYCSEAVTCEPGCASGSLVARSTAPFNGPRDCESMAGGGGDACGSSSDRGGDRSQCQVDPLDDGDWQTLDRFLEESLIPLSAFGEATSFMSYSHRQAPATVYFAHSHIKLGARSSI